MENDKIMGALIAGLIKVIDAFADKVAKRPLEIIILVLVSVGLAFKLDSAESNCERKIQALEIRMDTANKSWADALNLARTDFLECDVKREALGIEVKELRYIIARELKKKR